MQRTTVDMKVDQEWHRTRGVQVDSMEREEMNMEFSESKEAVKRGWEMEGGREYQESNKQVKVMVVKGWRDEMQLEKFNEIISSHWM